MLCALYTTMFRDNSMLCSKPHHLQNVFSGSLLATVILSVRSSEYPRLSIYQIVSVVAQNCYRQRVEELGDVLVEVLVGVLVVVLDMLDIMLVEVRLG